MRSWALLFAFGILLLQQQAAFPLIWPSVLGAGLLGLGAYFLRGRRRRLLLCLMAIFLGFAWAAWRAESRLTDALLLSLEGQEVEVVGVVAGLPQEFAGGSRFEFDIENASTNGLPSHLMLSWYYARGDGEGALPILHPGERWRLTIRPRRPHGNANPGGFDYEAWLLERNIRAIAYVRPAGGERLAERVWQPAYVIERLRDQARDNFRRALPTENYPLAGILTALAVGDQKAVNGELWTVFNRTGTTHLMSISGLHVTMVAGVFGALLGFVWRRFPVLANRYPAQKAALVAAALAALLYALLAGFAVPAQRTAYMLMVAGLALWSNRIVAPSRVLAGALIVVLLIDPWAVLAAGFWLSFAAVGTLLYVSAARVGTPVGWRERVRAWSSVQWAATLASLPILLLVFQQFSLISPLANAVAIPVVSFVVTPLALMGALLPWQPLLLLAHWVLEALLWFLEWCAQWPVWQAAAPPGWAVASAGVGVAVCLLPRGVPGRLLGGFLLLPALFWQPEKPTLGEAWVDVLDVGQGLATVIRTREHVLIYDPGPLYSAESDAGQRVVVPYLRWLGMNRVDMLVVTHRDADHSGGTASVRAALPVGEILSSLPELPGRLCAAGQRWVWDEVEFSVLHPEEDAAAVHQPKKTKTNHASCVIKVSTGQHSLLLTSDIEAPDEQALLQREGDQLHSDILLVPHHGSRTSSTPAFLDAVGARTAIVPVGYRNRFGHPKADVIERYNAREVAIWRTDREGAVQVRLGPDAAPTLSAWRREHARYWHGR